MGVSELLPCPFCGLDVTDDEGCYGMAGLWEVRCGNPNCFAHEPSDESREAAINRWNRRAALPHMQPAGEVVARAWRLVERWKSPFTDGGALSPVERLRNAGFAAMLETALSPTTPPQPSVQQEAQGAVACPKCGAPCKRTVNMRGGDYGWSTSDEERADYRYTPPAPVDVRRLLDHLGELRCYYVESRDGIKGYERREQQFTDLIAEVDADIALLSAQPSADAGDGKRYRWLRTQESRCDGHVSVNWNIGHDWIPISGDELDAAIDAAIAAQPRGEQENHDAN